MRTSRVDFNGNIVGEMEWRKKQKEKIGGEKKMGNKTWEQLEREGKFECARCEAEVPLTEYRPSTGDHYCQACREEATEGTR